MNDQPHGQIRETAGELRETTRAATGEAPSADAYWAEIWERPWLGFAIAALLPGIVLGFIGPFGSFDAPLAYRLAYWVPTMALGAVLGTGVSLALGRARMLNARPFLREAVATLAMTAIMSFVAWAMARVIFGEHSVGFSLRFVGYVFLISAVATVVVSIVRARRARVQIAAAPAAAAAPAVAVTLPVRLPEKLRGGVILALQGEDHYVRVHTDKGSDLILMRLTDAVREMGATPGARTHRSWWVARAAVKTIRRDDGRAVVVLSGDIEVPVSRGYAGELREAGWFEIGR